MSEEEKKAINKIQHTVKEWCQNDYFACLEIMQDIEYIYGAIQFEIMKEN